MISEPVFSYFTFIITAPTIKYVMNPAMVLTCHSEFMHLSNGIAKRANESTYTTMNTMPITPVMSPTPPPSPPPPPLSEHNPGHAHL